MDLQQSKANMPDGYEHYLFASPTQHFVTEKERLRSLPAHDPEDEPLPDLPWYQAKQHKTVDKEIGSIYKAIIDILKPASNADTSAIKLSSTCQKHRRNWPRPEIKIAVVGAMGHGKSTLINALLCTSRQDDIAVTRSVGVACTRTVVQYRFAQKRGEDDKEFEARVHFLNEKELEQMISDPLPMCRGFYSNQDVTDDPDRGLEKTRAEADKKRYGLIRKQPITAELLGTDDFVATTVAAAKDRIRETIDALSEQMRGKDYTYFVDSDDSIGNLWERLHSFLSDADGDWMWDLVRDVEVLFENPLLETGLTLIDCPGTGLQYP